MVSVIEETSAWIDDDDIGPVSPPANPLGALAPPSVASPAVTTVPVRDDLRALEGYHSPQVAVRVRLNTNESPAPPPAAWRDAFAAEVSRIDWHRYPDRAAGDLRDAIGATHGVGPRPGLRRQRIQRGAPDPVAHLRRRRSDGGHVRADVPAARAPRPDQRGDRGGRRAGRRLPPRPRRGRAGARSGPADRDVPLLTEQPDRPGRFGRRRRLRARAGAGHPGRRRGVCPVRAVVGARPRRRRSPARRHADLLQDVVDGRRPTRLPRRAGLAGGRAREGGAAVPPRRGEADRRPPGVALTSTRWRSGCSR